MADWFEQNAPASAPQGGDWFASNAPAPAEATVKTFGDHLADYWHMVNPKEQAQGVASLVTTDPRTTARDIGTHTDSYRLKAVDSFKKGNYAEAARHAFTYLTNGVSLGMTGQLDDAGDDLREGRIGDGITKTAALATNIVAGKKVGDFTAAATEPGAATTAVQKVRNAPAAVVDSVKTAAQRAADEYNTPGTKHILGGASETAGGVALISHEPVAGLAATADGIRRVQKGLDLRRAAQTTTVAEQARAREATSRASRPSDTQPFLPRTDTGVELSPEAEARIAARNADWFEANAPAPAETAVENPAPASASPAAASPQSVSEPGQNIPETIPAQPTLLDEPAYEHAAEPAPGAKPDYQAAARTVKGRALARFLSNPPEGPAITADEATRMTPDQWHLIAREAGVAAKTPPSPETVKIAIDHMREIGAKRAQRGLADTSTDAPGAAPAAAATLPADGGNPQEAGPGQSGDGSAAGAGEGLPPAAASQPSADPGRGSTTKVRVPGETTTYPAEYRVRELAELQPSHNGQTFQPNPKYRYKNDRDYSKRENQAKVVEGATPAKFDPAYHITDNPDLTNGPPMVDVDGNALGGNGRTMQMQRVYASNPAGAAAYRELLTQKAPQFGLDPAHIASMKEPVLVREVAEEHLAKPQDAITDVNKTGTAALTPAERAIADSRRVSPATLDDMAARLDKAGPDATLPKLLAGADGGQILEKLINDGVITSQERAAYAADGKLTKEGQARISKLMLGRFFRDPAQLDTIPPAVRTKIERLAGPLAKLEGAGEWNLMPVVKEGLDLLDEAHAHGTRNLTEFLKQSGLFGEERYSPDAVTMAKQLQRISAGRLVEQLKEYSAGEAYAREHAHAKGGLFGADVTGEPPNPRQSFDDAFGYSGKTPAASSTPATAPRAPRAARPKGKSTAEKLGDQFLKD